MKLIVKTYNLAGIGREEPTDIPPLRWVEYPTNHNNIHEAVTAHLVSEDDLDTDELEDAISTMELGADGALYHTEDYLTSYEIQL